MIISLSLSPKIRLCIWRVETLTALGEVAGLAVNQPIDKALGSIGREKSNTKSVFISHNDTSENKTSMKTLSFNILSKMDKIFQSVQNTTV